MEREKETCVVARPEKARMSKYAENMRKTMRISARRKKEVKKEFQDYLNNSCDVWKRKVKNGN